MSCRPTVRRISCAHERSALANDTFHYDVVYDMRRRTGRPGYESSVQGRDLLFVGTRQVLILVELDQLENVLFGLAGWTSELGPKYRVPCFASRCSKGVPDDIEVDHASLPLEAVQAGSVPGWIFTRHHPSQGYFRSPLQSLCAFTSSYCR